MYTEEAVAKQVNDYKIKLQKADQEVATLQATVCSFLVNFTYIYFYS